MKITVSIPCYRSAKTLPTVVSQIRTTIAMHLGYTYQIILVNDCSPDQTFEVIKQLCQEDENIVGINLSRNWGQATARMASIPYIKGDCTVFMDDDGQHPIEHMFDLIKKIEEGYDIVSADFSQKQTKFINRLTSSISSKLYLAMGKRPKGAISSAYFALNKMCTDSLKKYQSPFPSIFGYLYQIAGRITSVKLEHRKRLEGSSGYNFRKRFKVWLNGMVNFSIVPLQLSSLLGVIFSSIGFLTGVILVIRKLLNPNILMGYTSLITVVLVIGGLLMIMIGLMGEYIGRIYLTLSDQPQYEIRETLNTGENDSSGNGGIYER